MLLYRKYIYIESISMFENLSIFENLSMLENFSILVQKSVKGLGKCAHFPTVALMLLRGRMFRDLLRWSCSPILPKSSLINCLRLWFFRRIERTLLIIVYLTPTVNVGKMLYLYSIIKKATKKIENLFCSLPDSAMVALPCCGQVGKNAVRLLFDFKLKQINNVY